MLPMSETRQFQPSGDTVLIVPGLHGSADGHWQSIWQTRLPNSVRVIQDDWDTADLQKWSLCLLETSQSLERFWIVAHSFGVLTALYALPAIIDRVAGVFFVAPADPDKFAVSDLLPVLDKAVPGVLVASHTDPWMTFSKALQLAERYGLPVLDAGEAGHINVDSGYGEWPQGWQWFADAVAAS